MLPRDEPSLEEVMSEDVYFWVMIGVIFLLGTQIFVIFILSQLFTLNYFIIINFVI